MTNICIFCSASDGLDKIYYEDAEKLGKIIAKEGFALIYGGSTLGLMGTVSDAARKNGAKVTGVMPKKLCDMGVSSGNCDEFHITEGMRSRKAKIDEISDAVITLPGGFGTLEEVSEIIVQKKLGYNNKPIVILNTNGFYDKLLDFFDQIIDERFALPHFKNSYYVAKTPEDAVNYIKNYKPDDKEIDFDNIYVRKNY